MRTLELVFAAGWAAFLLYWLVAAFSTSGGRTRLSAQLPAGGLIAAIVVLPVLVGALRGGDRGTAAWRAAVGLALFVVGLGFAVWARLTIGRNWGTPMTRRDAPELVTSGPYRLVRHPIYSGVLAAGAGTALALRWQWLIAVGLATVYFVYSATVEERYLTEQFSDAYPAYKRSTKMLVPFIF